MLNSQSRDLSHETALRHESYHYTTSYLANIEIPLQEMCSNLYVHIKNKWVCYIPSSCICLNIWLCGWVRHQWTNSVLLALQFYFTAFCFIHLASLLFSVYSNFAFSVPCEDTNALLFCFLHYSSLFSSPSTSSSSCGRLVGVANRRSVGCQRARRREIEERRQGKWNMCFQSYNWFSLLLFSRDNQGVWQPKDSLLD